MIKLEYLRAFVAVAQTRGLSEAAERLGRTPSAVSMTLKQIEETLGGALFEGERKARLTPLGAYTMEHALRAIAEHDAATTAIERFARGDEGEVRIAAVPSVATQLLPTAVSQLRKRKPNIRINLRDTDSTTVVQSLEQKLVDIGIATPSTVSRSLTETPLLEDPFALICREDHALVQLGRPVAWQDIDVTEFIANGLCASVPAPELAELVRNAPLMVHNVSSLFAFITEGFGVTLLPALAVSEKQLGLRAVPLSPDARASRHLVTMVRPNETLTPAAEALLTEIHAAAHSLS